MTIRDSISYKDLEDELIDNEDWKNNKPLILKNLENHLISTDLEKILNDFESLLDGRYHEINQRITSGDNKKIKTKLRYWYS